MPCLCGSEKRPAPDRTLDLEPGIACKIRRKSMSAQRAFAWLPSHYLATTRAAHQSAIVPQGTICGRPSARQRPVVNAHTRQATLQSLGQLITQLKEEIARYETRHAVPH
jgi:hypothetical protein